ncbi:MAG TPA: 2Fe-2S iron-sulfur cluster-binding protein [Polyangia bacterium]
MPRVTFQPSGKAFDVRRGGTVLRAAVRARMHLGRSCRGDGVCAACKVRVLAGAAHLAPPTPVEQRLIARRPLDADERYACQARVLGDVTVTTSYW